MKVLHLISGGDKGGAKTHVFTLLSALMEEIDIRVICFMEGVFYNEIKDMPIPSELYRQKYRNDLTIIPPLIKHIRKERYNIIHAHGARANFIALFLKPFIKVPIITTVHSDYKLDFTDNAYKKYFYTGLNIMALRQLNYFIAVSNSFKDMLMDRGFPEDKIYTVYNTIDFEKEINYMPRPAFLKRIGVSDDKKIFVGIIGRLDQVKGHEVFLNAAAEVLKQRQDVLFLLAGEGGEQSNLEQQAKRLGISEHVRFLGFIDDIFSFINILDINVATSHSESFPYMLLEGAMMKKATVSTAVGGIVDLIKEEETGLLAADGDYKTIAKGILRLMDDPTLRESLGNRLYDYARTNFSRESMKQSHVAIYRSIIRRQQEADKIFDVALSGYYGFDNSGDDAILKSIIMALRKEKPDIKILVFTKKPRETKEEYGVFSVSRRHFFAAIKYMKRCRVFIYGGGSIIQDITSTQSLVYYTLMLRLAKFYGLKVMMYANGIGPVVRKYNFKRARRALEMCDYISLRDPQSMNDLKRLGVENENVHLSVDAVFTLDMDHGPELEKIFAAEGISPEKKYFAVSLRMWRYNELGFNEKMVSVINEIARRHSLIPLYIPMQAEDYNIIREIIAGAKGEHILLSRIYNVNQLMGIIHRTEFVMAMRLHTLIYAASVSVPMIGLVYDPKVQSFMEYIGESYYMDTSDLDQDGLLAMAGEIMADLPGVKARIAIQCQKLKEASGKDAKEAVKLL